jgi:hypothetical protein
VGHVFANHIVTFSKQSKDESGLGELISLPELMQNPASTAGFATSSPASVPLLISAKEEKRPDQDTGSKLP